MRIFLAFSAFFKILFDREFAATVKNVGNGDPAPKTVTETKPARKSTPPKPKRSEALTLLAALQREARLLDLIQEPLGDYSNEQIGAAAKDVLRDSAKVLDRFFAIKPLTDQAEGSELQTPAQFDPQQFHLTGNVSGEPPFKGQLTHPGWTASRCEIPAWTGSEATAKIIAPVEIQIG